MQRNVYHRKYFRTPFSADYWRQAFSELKNTRALVFAALILALRIAMKPLKIPIAADVNITFGFVVNALGAAVYGPVVALLSAALQSQPLATQKLCPVHHVMRGLIHYGLQR